MHLKSLEIQGFKSFPERTVILFHTGVTAIVGPNGSGKSNVTDAIRWVLGEQSVKTLRGAKMEDIIFSGTQSRKAMSFAEVTMTIDNQDQKIPFEYNEIQITRRLYRSGESEYLLNKTNCRLKDIVNLFMDTGLGRDGYSIIGQGKVDDILSHRSEDRRRIFEEASGIVKFKTRKEEAEKKLAATDQNLLRINDIIQELSEQMEPLAEQAKATREYLGLKEELQAVEMAYLLHQVDLIQTDKDKASQEIDLLNGDRSEQLETLAKMRADNKELSEDIHALDELLEAQNQEIADLKLKTSALSGTKALNIEKINQLKMRTEQGLQIINESKTAISLLATDISDRQMKVQNLNRQREVYKGKLEQAQADMLQLQESLSQQENELIEWKNQLDQGLEAVYEENNELSQLQGQKEQIIPRIKTLGLESDGLAGDRNRIQFRMEDLREHHTKLAAQWQQNQDDINLLERDLASEKEHKDKLTADLEKSRQSLRDLQYRLKTLEDMEKNLEGYYKSVKKVMQMAKSSDEFEAKVLGTVGELITVDKKFEKAAETALGAAIQNIVTDDDETAGRLIDWLKINKAGRATFLPLNQIRGRKIDPAIVKIAAGLSGYQGVASDLITGEAYLNEVLVFLLGRVIFVETLEQARLMARNTGFKVRIITLEGDVINRGGSMSGGYQQQGSTSLLGRSRYLKELPQMISLLSIEIEANSLKLEEVTNKYEQLLSQIEMKKSKMSELMQKKVQDETQMAAVEEELAKTEGRLTVLQQEAEQLQKLSEETTQRQREIRESIQEKQAKIERMRLDINERDTKNQVERAQRDDIRESITDYKVSLNSIEESLSSAQELSDRIEAESKEHQIKIEKQKSLNQEYLNEINLLQESMIKLQEEIGASEQIIESLDERIKEHSSLRVEFEQKQDGYYERFELATGRLSSIENEIVKMQARVTRLEQQDDDLKNKIWEEYELTVTQADKWRKPIDNKAATIRIIEELKKNIKELGPINLTAIESFASVQERHEFMAKQRDDIEKAGQKLTVVIKELTEAMKKQFVEHFYQINENFREVFAELFGGGMAELHMDDSEDVLSSGIEIKAQPPGKRLQNLTLLSGGERCLTAIALLFAILKLRPTPFCVFDEVEAALDEANVTKFTRYIKNYARSSQFILVTHRKGTMEAADRLYGVTMQERGISRILSMKMAEDQVS